MPKNTVFRSNWLLKLDNTGRVCSRWLTKGKTTSSFKCIVCKTDDLSCANGGWSDIKKHYERPKHIQCMKDVFGSVPLIDERTKELTNATKMLEEGSARLVAAINNKKLDDIGTTEVLVTAANAKLAVLKTQLIENSENLNRLRKQQKK